MTEVIAITGGKGGTGKSTVATALAYELSKNHSVLLVDADVDCPNDHLLLNIKLSKFKTVYQRIPEFDSDKCTKCSKCGLVCVNKAIVSLKNKFPIFIPEQCNGCGSCKIVCPSEAISWKQKEIGGLFIGNRDNLNLLSGDLKANQPISEFIVNSLNEEIEKQITDFEYIIIDTAAGIHCPVIAAFELANKVIAVTEPTPLGAHDLDVILILLKKLNKSASIIVNKSDIGNISSIFSLAKKHNTRIIKEIPFNKDIVKSYSLGSPIQIPDILEVVQK